MFSLPHVVPKFLLLGLMLIGAYGLNIPDSTVLSNPVKLLIWTCCNLIFMYHFPFASILFLQKDKDVLSFADNNRVQQYF